MKTLAPGEPSSPQILLVDDEPAFAASIADLLTLEGYEVWLADSLLVAREVLARQNIELVLLDLTLTDGSGLELFSAYSPPPQGPITVVLTADRSLQTAVEAVRRGAFDYLPKPCEVETLLHRVHMALEHQRALASQSLSRRVERLGMQSRPILPLSSPAMTELHDSLLKVAPHDTMAILVRGETGVGKEHICRLIHDSSPRAGEPYVAINCANLDRNLLCSELFGHERGAFTGAKERRRGLFELASRGTLLLDEVAEMPQDVQSSFLRVLETGRFRRLGGTIELSTGARILASTNADVEALVRAGRMRSDLFYRLHGIVLTVPPLRERGADVRALASYFCVRMAASKQLSTHLTEEALSALGEYSWPGNVRELKNVVERAVVLRGHGPIQATDLQLPKLGVNHPTDLAPAAEESNFPTLAESEALHIRRALDLCQGNRTHAARLLNVARSTLLRKIENLRVPTGSL